MAESESAERKVALAAAVLGEALILALRARNGVEIEKILRPGGPAWLAFDIFGEEIFRLWLRLDDPQEQGLLAPYDLQIEGEVALLELGVVHRLQPEVGETTPERSHLSRVFGSGILLTAQPQAAHGWLIEEVFPVNADGQLHQDNATDNRILAIVQGRAALPLREDRLDPIERAVLHAMQNQVGKFLLEELYNVIRLWRDFQAVWPEEAATNAPLRWAAGLEYLITVFDYHHANAEEIASRYKVDSEDVTDAAREIAAVLRVTQFDDRYSIHPDPVSHYRTLFQELGINPKRDDEVAQANLNKVFDFVEVPPDDETFFGPR